MPTALLVDDDALSLQVLKVALQGAQGFQTWTARDGQEAIQVLERRNVDLLVTDLAMPGLPGQDLIRYVEEFHPHVPVIVVSGVPFEATGLADREKAVCFLPKPVDPRRLRQEARWVLQAIEPNRIRGVDLPDLLQMFNLEKKSCRVRVEWGGAFGSIHMRKGDIIHAAFGDLLAEAALGRMLRLAGPNMLIQPFQEVEPLISSSFAWTMMRAAKIGDEERTRQDGLGA